MSGQDHHDSDGRARRTSHVRGLLQLVEPPTHCTRGPYFVFLSLEFMASQVVLEVKNLPTNAGRYKKRVRSLGQEDPLEKDMATHSSILAWKIPWTEESGGLQSMGSQRVWTQLT